MYTHVRRRAHISRCVLYCRTFLEGKRGPLRAAPSLALALASPVDPLAHAGPRHAQQTSPTTRHAAFIMFPRSSFDGSTAAAAADGADARVEGQWAPDTVSALFAPKSLNLPHALILQLRSRRQRARNSYRRETGERIENLPNSFLKNRKGPIFDFSSHRVSLVTRNVSPRVKLAWNSRARAQPGKENEEKKQNSRIPQVSQRVI